MGDAIGLDGVDERPGDRFLADELGEVLRPIAPGQDGVAFAGGDGERQELGRWLAVGHGAAPAVPNVSNPEGPNASDP